MISRLPNAILSTVAKGCQYDCAIPSLNVGRSSCEIRAGKLDTFPGANCIRAASIFFVSAKPLLALVKCGRAFPFRNAERFLTLAAGATRRLGNAPNMGGELVRCLHYCFPYDLEAVWCDAR